MAEEDPLAVIISVVQQVAAGPFSALYASLPAQARSKGPALDHCEIGAEGVSVYLLAQRPDDRYLFWQVEVWPTAEIHAEDGWRATVKGEIDLDGVEGDPRCVLNEQQTVTSAKDAVTAIQELAQLVCAYPVSDLMTMSPPTDEED